MPILHHRHLSLGTLLYIGSILILLSLIGWYALFQARHVIDGPTITLTHETNRVVTEPTVVIAGRAEDIVSLTLNDRPIYTDDHGNFEDIVVLPPGYTVVTLRAEDRYGRVHTLTRDFIRS